MTVSDILTIVDSYRPNLLSSNDKVNHAYAIEKEIIDHMSLYGEPLTISGNFGPTTRLSLGTEYTDLYVYYIVSVIDLANQDVAMYNNSCTYFNKLLSDWKKKWRREHTPVTKEG